MKRSPMPPRTKRLPSSPIARKRRTKAERDEKFAREYGGESRHAWIAAQGCLVCAHAVAENAHTANGGMGRKAPAETIVPLCTTHHRELHRIGVKSFQRRHKEWFGAWTLADWAAHFDRLWKHDERQPAHVSVIVHGVVASLLEQRTEESA